MKQYFVSLLLLSACLAGCKSDPKQVEINGEIEGLTADTIYLYGNDELSDFIIPIGVKDGKFSLETDMDTTLIQATLFLDRETQYPVYLERGRMIRIKADLSAAGSYEAEGSPVNEEFTAFRKTLLRPADPNDTLSMQLAGEYIRLNQKSPINIYLLDRFFVQKPSPDLAGIKELIGIMDGSLQDKPYVRRLTELIEQHETAEVDKIAPMFTLTNTEGKSISRSEFRDRHLLISFWASWSDASKRSNQELKKVYKQYPPKTQYARDREKRKEKYDKMYRKTPELTVVGISLDMDKAAWKEAVKQDTLKWEQLNDFTGWNSTVVKQYGVTQVPYNILIDNRGKIIARGIRGEELNHKLDSLLRVK
ncbi:MAG: AhpC/TSA family protein [Mediterranea sp.]|jgi:peroxiredoxin|nr:AhpC/TSA family protein [Mediterranea sp.]